MIHDIINILLTVLLVQQVIFYLVKKYGSESFESFQNMSLSTNDINLIVEALLKKIFLKQRDEGVVYNPLKPPEQRIEETQYPFPNTKWWERTRGDPDEYQLVGLLYNTDSNKNYQLYGRRVYPGSYEWEYYIRGKDVGGLDYKLPIAKQNKEEIRDGENISVPIDSNTYSVSIYNFDQPRYNPFPNF
jgi:hypothetical protein